MDERRLAELFRDAADDAAGQAPPATFDHADVLAGSRRAHQRHQRRVAGGVAVAAVAVAAVGLAGAGVFGSSTGTSSTLAGPAPASAPDRPGFAPDARSARPLEAAPPGAPQAAVPYGSGPGAAASPGAPGAPAPAPAPKEAPNLATPFDARQREAPAGCAGPDPELFAQLAAVLPAVKDAIPRAPSDSEGCPPGARGVEVDVDDGGVRGTLRVVLSPAGSGVAGMGASGSDALATARKTRAGDELSVTVIAAGPGQAPFVGQLNRIATDLAGRH
ncbi:hypothetical protein [Pseudonocardia acaciae]|uniref:hypothetical protein n=1 Tax=Pseudonocardia acaciae TaxID=551276 RepID=UPI00048E5207|nr:hypothetical protein [Pseudonocardia acaciae]